MLLECVRYPCGGGRNIELSLAVLLAALDASLDFPDVVEIVAETDAIPGTEPPLQARGTVGDGIENAPVFLIRVRRRSAVPGASDSLSKTTRGLISVGSGIVGVRQEMLFT